MLCEGVVVFGESKSPAKKLVFKYPAKDKYQEFHVEVKPENHVYSSLGRNASGEEVGPLGEFLKVRKIDPKTNELEHFDTWFMIDKAVGGGVYGNVYKAYSIDKNGEVDTSKPVAIKVFHNSEDFVAQEFNKDPAAFESTMLRYLFPDDSYTMPEVAGKKFLVMPFIEGKPLRNSRYELSLLNLEERIRLITDLAFQLTLLHSQTLAKNVAAIHLDLNASNIMVALESKPKRKVQSVSEEVKTAEPTRAVLIDFNLSRALDGSNSRISVGKIEDGFIYFPPEAVLGEDVGVKTDIYMMVPNICRILGVDYPLSDREPKMPDLNTEEYSEAIRKLPLKEKIKRSRIAFPTNKIIDDFPYILDVSLRKLTIEFLNRMQSNDYDQRPDTHEMREFFVTLYNVIRIHKNYLEKEARVHQEANLAKLIVLAKGLWNVEIGQREIESFDTVKKDEKKAMAHVENRGKDVLPRYAVAGIHDEWVPVEKLIAPKFFAHLVFKEDDDTEKDKKSAKNAEETKNVKETKNPQETRETSTKYQAMCQKIISVYKKGKPKESVCDVLAEASYGGIKGLVKHLLESPPTKITEVLKHVVNSNRHAIVDESVRQLKSMDDAQKLEFCRQIFNSQNVLGAILNTPRSNFSFKFSTFKYGKKKVTRSIYRLLSAVFPSDEPLNIYKSSHLHR